METEVWPNLMHAARRAGVPMVLANARLSARSAGARASGWRALMRPALASFTRVLAQTAGRRAAPARGSARPTVQVCGNLKFDMTPAARAAGARPCLARRARRGRWC